MPSEKPYAFRRHFVRAEEILGKIAVLPMFKG